MADSCDDLEELNFLLTNVESTVPIELESYLEDEFEGNVEIHFDFKKNLSTIDKSIKNYNALVSGYNGGIGLNLLKGYKKKELDIPFIIIFEDTEQLNNEIKKDINRYFLEDDLKNQYSLLIKSIIDEVCNRGTNADEFSTDYRILFNSMDDAAFVHDLEGHTLAVNEAAVERIGYSREELLEMKPEDIDKSDHLREIQKKIYNLKEGENLTFETKQVTKGGQEIPVEINSKLIHYNGRLAVLSIARDISEKRKALKTSKSYKKMIKRFFQFLPEPGMLINSDEKILSINRAFENYFGYEKSEIEGKKIEDSNFIPLSKRKKVRRHLKARLKGKFISSYEIPLRTKEGKLKEVSVYGFPLDKDGDVFGVMLIFKNVGENQELVKLRTKTDKLKETFNSLDDILIFLNQDLEIEEINRSSLDIFNREREELLGKKIYDAYNVRSFKVESFKELITTKNRIDLEIYDKNIERYLEINNKPIKTNQELIGYVHHAKDITRRKEIEKREKYLHETLKSDLKNNILKKIQTIELLRKIEDFEEQKSINLGLRIQKAIDNNKKTEKKRDLEIKYQKKDFKVLGGQLLDEMFSFILEIIINKTNGNKIKIKEIKHGKKILVKIIDNGTKTPKELEKISKKGIGKKIESNWKIYLAKKIIDKYQGSFKLSKSEDNGMIFKISLKSPKSDQKNIKLKRETQSASKAEEEDSTSKGGIEDPWCEKCEKPMIYSHSTDKGMVYKCQTCGDKKIIKKHMSGTNVIKF